MKGGGKMAELEEVYSLYFKDVYRYALSLCKNENMARFDGKCKIYVWLCQIAKNTYFSHLKKENRYDSGVQWEEIAAEDDPEREALHKAEVFELHKRLHALEEPYKEVFSLRTFGELPFAQIAELFGKTESWARVTYHRARLKIKEDII